MKKQETEAINIMRLQGKSPSEIACYLGIPVNTVRTHIRRHPEIHGGKPCETCGRPLLQPVGRKEKRFCSDKCRMAWWNSHRELVQKNNVHIIFCRNCGKEFEVYGKKSRKYCCRNCYFAARQSRISEGAGSVPVFSGGAGYDAA